MARRIPMPCGSPNFAGGAHLHLRVAARAAAAVVVEVEGRLFPHVAKGGSRCPRPRCSRVEEEGVHRRPRDAAHHHTEGKSGGEAMLLPLPLLAGVRTVTAPDVETPAATAATATTKRKGIACVGRKAWCIRTPEAALGPRVSAETGAGETPSSTSVYKTCMRTSAMLPRT